MADRNKKLKDMFKKYLKVTKKEAQAAQSGTRSSPSSTPTPSLCQQEKEERAKENDFDEFETVAVAARPAVSKIRQKQLKWKQDTDVTEKTADEGDEMEETKKGKGKKGKQRCEESAADSSQSEQSKRGDEVSVAVRRKKKSVTATKEESDSASDRTTDVDVEPLKDKLASQVTTEARLRKKLKRREKRIDVLRAQLDETKQLNRQLEKQVRQKTTDELKTQILEIEQLKVRLREIEQLTGMDGTGTGAGTKEAVEVTKEDTPTMDKATMETAASVLGLLKRNQLMERPLNTQETMKIAAYFGEKNAKPDQAVVMLVDKAISSAVDVLYNRPHEVDDIIDNKMRMFVIDRVRAKTLLLEVMLSRPEFVPISWGGSNAPIVTGSNKSSAEEAKKVQEAKEQIAKAMGAKQPTAARKAPSKQATPPQPPSPSGSLYYTNPAYMKK